MSLTLTLASAVIFAAASIGSMTTLTVLAEQAEKAGKNNGAEPVRLQSVDTIFVDADMLIETLKAHGVCVNNVEVLSENEVLVDTECGKLRYYRACAVENFKLEFGMITDQKKFIEQLKSFEKEYGRNVQTYTYNHIKENLTDDMKIESEEVLEDDSLMITIDI